MDDVLMRFLSVFNEIENFLAQISPTNDHLPFSRLVDKWSEKSPKMKRLAYDLKEFGELRNALMHGYSNDHPLATPYPTTVDELARLRDLLKAPPRLGQTNKGKVFTCTPDQKLSGVARTMFDNDWSQVPTYQNGQFIGLLNTDTIARWLTTRLEIDEMLEEDNVGNVLPHATKVTKHKLLSEQDTAFDALQAFEKSIDLGHSLDAVIITAHGKTTESPTGIITVFDIPKLQSLVTVGLGKT